MNKTLFAISSIVGYTEAFCSYPMWTIPKTGTAYRCDWDSCPMRPEAYCDDIYGVAEGETCKVTCERNFELYEVYECVENETWRLISEEVDCKAPGTSSASSLVQGTTVIAFTVLTMFQMCMLQ